MNTKPKVAVLMGGRSAEREISIMTGEEIYKALVQKGYPAVKVYLDENVVENLKRERVDVVFIALHGRYGEDGTVQGMLEILGLPYTGSGVLASALGINKIMAKRIFKASGVNTADFCTISQEEYKKDPASVREKLIGEISFPMVIKPAREGSTIGLSVVQKADQLHAALQDAFGYDEQLLVEKFIEGTEVTVGILGDKDPEALPTLEVISKKGIYDYQAKYTPGMSEHIIPARIPPEHQRAVQEMALKAHKALGCRGFSRVDTIVTREGIPYILEVNTIPGMTSLSLFPDAARAAGIPFPDLVSKIVEMALEK
ncbi:MAG: D-alanine--D-alanine ligase [Actinomycetota bacterium]|nr:D-alanine--D-alanine ligase [Actinomycetota bacterium]MDI6822341.1 D-alanine--D-alanine ligase [Actinomycetota bacterium]